MDFDASEHDERDAHNGANNTTKEDGTGPACRACRKKKAKCSRQRPCSHCLRNDITCQYDAEKGKPGMKAGAIDRLTKRIDDLESMFLGQGVLIHQLLDCLQTKGIHEPVSTPSTNSLAGYTSQVRQTLHDLGQKRSAGSDLTSASTTGPAKRRRVEQQATLGSPSNLQHESADNGFLPPDLVDTLVEIYFDRIHPWIPILHVRQFRQRMVVPTERLKLSTILRAIVSVTVRFQNDHRLGDAEAKLRLAQLSRQAVILQSMESFSVENLQALIICAFDTIGSGRGPSAWSIVGSMARTVEQLQLSIEDEDQASIPGVTQALVKRMHFLPSCKDWTEREERRRVFWNVFLMDRFCSIATGWNVCLTSADVKRRLPCEGALWEEGRSLETPTPYFGVSDPPCDARQHLPNVRSEEADQASLGGFAYCIEATESLSLVTSFFLQQAVDVAKAHDVQLWLMRFKQLDLRLVQWKLFLPERWREACALNSDGNMDPNLTLAHITHNTAVVLLHQGIAYPSSEWQSLPINLPSAASAKTCMAAAVEVSIITDEFLRNSKCLTNPQFAFCLFICGRMLITHSLYYSIPLPRQFDSLLESLMEMANRWNGDPSAPGGNLSSKFALRLNHARNYGDQTLDIRQAAYPEHQLGTAKGSSDDIQQGNGASGVAHSMPGACGENPPGATGQCETPDSITLAFPPLPLAFQAQPSSKDPTAMPSPNLDYLGYTSLGQGNEHTIQSNGASSIPEGLPFDGNGQIAFEDLGSFLDCSFLPNQRVSAFSS
ncbi:hypothetical protein BU24DRAFT_25930 [Aaosphaeria arxii CBS 175.79]|uniref:Zn(2)-C6 fungal-type domain-containing protein n=1 Tax=Aaosphaeria arxii CBS 175.79 TaxID=1450172 RepID=A0A6A5Y8J3_9PLEO|nr:uncharacterized protein BU24DRAFT_25930 [Aaosphaeria arxii CBS 175.79]KAF2021718.1 hypothetical protein BU24DRAFT_25930 [Aaosphaeria arxii CBS 175.79]